MIWTGQVLFLLLGMLVGAALGAQEPIARPTVHGLDREAIADKEVSAGQRPLSEGLAHTVGSHPSPRSHEVFRRDCYSSLGREEVTLFANGTVRLRSGPAENMALWLHELETEETEAFVARLAEIDLHESPKDLRSVTGAWVENCQLHLDLPESTASRYQYARYDSLTLALQRVVRVVEDVLAEVDRERAPEGVQQLPADYTPAVGDRLRRTDGAVFEVIGRTADQRGVELQGDVLPLALYVPISELRRQFVSVEARER